MWGDVGGQVVLQEGCKVAEFLVCGGGARHRDLAEPESKNIETGFSVCPCAISFSLVLGELNIHPRHGADRNSPSR